MKVTELSNTQLDYWVAKAEGIEVRYSDARQYWRIIGEPDEIQWLPHRDWSQAGPIMEREGIGFQRQAPAAASGEETQAWLASDARGDIRQYGPNPLVAAMRVYVAGAFGEELEEV